MAKQMYSTNDIAKKDVVDPKRAMEAQVWIQTVLGIQIQGDFFDELRDGVLLCEMLNKIQSGSCKKFKKTSIAFVARNNIDIFIRAAKKLGVPQTELFETRDLYDQQRLSAVVRTIYAVSSKSRDIGYSGPCIGVSYHRANRRNFSQEVLNKSKSAVPLMNQGDKAHKTQTMDGYGIIKTDMNKHSNVPSVWDKGSKSNDTGPSNDAYGIVKNKKVSNTKFSNVQSVWQKGARSNAKNSSNLDSYGIVKTDKSMQSPSTVQSKWQQGSNPVNRSNNNHDSYGIVKTSKDMQRPSEVQSKWQQGSIAQGNAKKMDAYGIVKSQNNDSVHSNVQSVWQRGSNAVDKGDSQDSYGIIKNVK